MSIKKIGIPGWVIDNKVFGVTLPYGEYIRRFGQMIILTPDEPVRDDLDLLFLPGGLDVNPSRQNGKLSLYTGSSNSMLEYFDEHRLPGYIDNNTPIFGVCRGAQSLYSIFGGKLDQHNFVHTQSEFPKDQCHALCWHGLENYNKYNNLLTSVNSRHHQTLLHDENNLQLETIAVAREYYTEKKYLDYYNIVEVFKHREKPIWGVQYHPEDCYYDNFTPMIIKELMENKVEEQVEI